MKIGICVEKNVLSSEQSVYSALIQGVEGSALREEKKSSTSFLCRNTACHLRSVEQNVLIKAEGLDGQVLHFTLDNLRNPEYSVDQFKLAAQSETVDSPCTTALS